MVGTIRQLAVSHNHCLQILSGFFDCTMIFKPLLAWTLTRLGRADLVLARTNLNSAFVFVLISRNYFRADRARLLFALRSLVGQPQFIDLYGHLLDLFESYSRLTDWTQLVKLAGQGRHLCEFAHCCWRFRIFWFYLVRLVTSRRGSLHLNLILTPHRCRTAFVTRYALHAFAFVPAVL